MSGIVFTKPDTMRWKRALASNAGLLIVLVLLVLMLTIGAAVSDRFRSVGNIANVLEQSTGLALVRLGQTLAVLTGGIDLAVGSLISLVICLTAGLLNGESTYLYSVLAGMLVLGGRVVSLMASAWWCCGSIR